MNNPKPRRAAVIGLDCALPHLIERHIKEGHLPNLARLIKDGALAENCLVPFPTVTPPGWATIATGATVGTHQVTDFTVPTPGATPDNASAVAAFSSQRSRAEYVWDALDRQGQRCVLLNYPGSWPARLKHGVVIGGEGLSVGEHRDGLWGLDSRQSIAHEQLISTDHYPGGLRSQWRPAQGWRGLENGAEALEMEARLTFPRAAQKPAPTVWHLLALPDDTGAYASVVLAPEKNLETAFCTLGPGQWSGKINTVIEMADGSRRHAFFRAKLLELSEEAEDFRLYLTSLCAADGWSHPPEAAGMIQSEGGVFAPGGGILAYSTGWIDLETYLELNEFYTQWLSDAAQTLLAPLDWDLFMMHSHPPDWLYHALMNDINSEDEAVRERAWAAHLRVYQSQDQMIGRLLEILGDDTLVITVSDHGATPDGPVFDPCLPLEMAGLMVRGQREETGFTGFAKKALEATGMDRRPDPVRSRAIPQREIYVYVNLEGRDPEGIVSPKDYATVQQEIIDALLAWRDPATGVRPVALALSKEDARLLGLHGELVGDVVYAIYPSFGSQHGQILPTAAYGAGSLKGLLTFTGPGVKSGVRLKRTVGLEDVVPTLCHMLGFKPPRQAEGGVIYQALTEFE